MGFTIASVVRNPVAQTITIHDYFGRIVANEWNPLTRDWMKQTLLHSVDAGGALLPLPSPTGFGYRATPGALRSNKNAKKKITGNPVAKVDITRYISASQMGGCALRLK